MKSNIDTVELDFILALLFTHSSLWSINDWLPQYNLSWEFLEGNLNTKMTEIERDRERETETETEKERGREKMINGCRSYQKN